MKKILMGMLLISGLCSFKGDPPDPAIRNGAITPFVAYAYPFFSDTKHTGMFIAGAEYQVSRGFNAGLQYAYYEWRTPMQVTWNSPNGARYQIGDVMRGPYCYGYGRLLFPEPRQGKPGRRFRVREDICN